MQGTGIKATIDAIVLMLKSKRQLTIAILAAISMLIVALFIPILTIPGNTIDFQLSLVTWDYALFLIIFSVLFGLSIGLHAYPSSNSDSSLIGKGSGAGFAGILGTLFAGKLCPVCLSTILGMIGMGGSALFLFSYRNEILIASAAILLLSIYLGAKKAARVCSNCG